ncbi:MAG TPA: rhodanese-like domain-containing protein, partial [Polyangiaceae bacterium]|nr:rhodanese-like domain-containing protein [Polyangiaceae bacterium]
DMTAAVQRMSATDAVHLAKVGYIFIDVRTEEEYSKGHPSGALNVPFKHYGKGGSFRDNPDFMKVMETLYPKETKLLLIGKIGKRSFEAGEMLIAAGYTTVADLRPGVIGLIDGNGRYIENGWRTLGLPEETFTEGGTYREMRARAGL